MRHATVWALESVCHWLPEDSDGYVARRACDWETDLCGFESSFTAMCAYMLRDGESVELPTCPACAALLDFALEMRRQS